MSCLSTFSLTLFNLLNVCSVVQHCIKSENRMQFSKPIEKYTDVNISKGYESENCTTQKKYNATNTNQ